jgi:hypothetical protein
VEPEQGVTKSNRVYAVSSDTQHQLCIPRRYRTASPNKQWLMKGTTSYHLGIGMCIWTFLAVYIADQRPKINFDRKWISEINQPDTDQQRL